MLFAECRSASMPSPSGRFTSVTSSSMLVVRHQLARLGQRCGRRRLCNGCFPTTSWMSSMKCRLIIHDRACADGAWFWLFCSTGRNHLLLSQNPTFKTDHQEQLYCAARIFEHSTRHRVSIAKAGTGRNTRLRVPWLWPAFQADRSAAGFDPPQRLGQSHAPPPAGGFGAEERIERPLQRLLVHPAAVVRDRSAPPSA